MPPKSGDDKGDLLKRSSIRFTPDEGTYAVIDTEPNRPDGSFHPSMIALVPEESSKGAGLVMLNSTKLQEGSYCRVQVGKLLPMLAEVRWRKEVDEKIMRIGLLFLE